jgi:hypothetical protein
VMIEGLLLILCIIAAARWLPLWNGWDSAKRMVDRASRPKLNYHSLGASSDYPAVSIRVAQDCCQAVRETSGTRYLSTQAPLLPLPACTSEKCRCTYAHHTERRKGTYRRRPLLASYKDIFPPAGITDKRHLKGRRIGDLTSV